MSLAGEAVLKGVQEFVTEQQAAEFLQRERIAGIARGICRAKAPVRFAHGVRQCGAEPTLNQATVSRPGKYFRPLQGWLCGQTTPELYLKVRWASLIPYGGVARLLEDVLPVAYTQNGMTIRNHVLETAERIETDLGEEKPVFFDGSE